MRPEAGASPDAPPACSPLAGSPAPGSSAGQPPGSAGTARPTEGPRPLPSWSQAPWPAACLGPSVFPYSLQHLFHVCRLCFCGAPPNSGAGQSWGDVNGRSRVALGPVSTPPVTRFHRRRGWQLHAPKGNEGEPEVCPFLPHRSPSGSQIPGCSRPTGRAEAQLAASLDSGSRSSEAMLHPSCPSFISTCMTPGAQGTWVGQLAPQTLTAPPSPHLDHSLRGSVLPTLVLLRPSLHSARHPHPVCESK